MEAPLLELNLGTEESRESAVKLSLGDALRLRKGDGVARRGGSRPVRGIAGLTGIVRRNDRPQIQDVRPQGPNEQSRDGNTGHALAGGDAFERRRRAKQSATPPARAPCVSVGAACPNLDLSMGPAKPASGRSLSAEDHEAVMVLNPLAPETSRFPPAASTDWCQHTLNQARESEELDPLRRHSTSSLPARIGPKDSPSPDSMGAPISMVDELGVEGGATAQRKCTDSAAQDGASRRPDGPQRDPRQRSFSVHQTIHEQGGYKEHPKGGYKILDSSWPETRASLAEASHPHRLRSPGRGWERAGGRRTLDLHHSHEHPSGSGMGFALPPSVPWRISLLFRRLQHVENIIHRHV